MKTFNIAIVGLGNIGLEVYKNLLRNKNNIFNKTGFRLNIYKFHQRIFRKKEEILRYQNLYGKKMLLTYVLIKM